MKVVWLDKSLFIPICKQVFVVVIIQKEEKNKVHKNKIIKTLFT